MSVLITPWKNRGKQGPACVCERETEKERGGGQIINPHKVQQKMIADLGSPGLGCSASSSLSAPAHRSSRRSFGTLQGYVPLYLISGPCHLSNMFNTSWAFSPPLGKTACRHFWWPTRNPVLVYVLKALKFISIFYPSFRPPPLLSCLRVGAHMRCWQAGVTWAILPHDVLSYFIRGRMVLRQKHRLPPPPNV